MKRSQFLRRICGALTAGALSLTMLPMQAGAADVWDDMITVYDDLLPGDVNDDGTVTVVDLIVYQGWILMHDNVTMYAPWNADINADGDIDVFDLALAKRIVLGNGTVIPVNPDVPSEPETPVTPAEGGSIYQMIELTDPQIGVTVYRGLLPEGWTAQIQSNWGLINPNPGAETITFVSPDGEASVTIDSPLVFEEATDRGYGADISNFITFQPYRNASDFIDNYIQNTYSSAELVRDVEITAEEQADIDAFTEVYATNGINTAITYSRYQITGYGAEGTLARRQYRIGEGYCECSAAISAYQYSYPKVIMNVTETWWQILRSATYTAENKEAFDKYYSDYEVIMANGYFTAAFYSALHYVSQQIFNMMVEARTDERIREIAGGYADSGTKITSEDQSTQDRVFQAWDDYIKDEDRYTTTDGNQVTTSMFNETVAQDGDRFYVGSRTGIPDGFTELTKVTPLTP